MCILGNVSGESVKKRNWLGATQSGPKRPIFCLRRDHADQLQKKQKNHRKEDPGGGYYFSQCVK
jgi:hypothetical protein